SGDTADDLGAGAESQLGQQLRASPFAQRLRIGRRVESVVNHHDFAGTGAAHFQNVIAYPFGVHQQTVRELVNVPRSPTVNAAVGKPQMALRRDHSDPAQSRGGHAQRAGVKIVGVQNRYALLDHRRAEPQKLFNRVRVEKAVQGEFRHVWETRDDLLA